ncbi:hypothetical protein P7K49_023468, partial [Saguinus oedipus]
RGRAGGGGAEVRSPVLGLAGGLWLPWCSRRVVQGRGRRQRPRGSGTSLLPPRACRRHRGRGALAAARAARRLRPR